MKVRTALYVPTRANLFNEAVALIEHLARVDWEAHKLAGPFLARVAKFKPAKSAPAPKR